MLLSALKVAIGAAYIFTISSPTMHTIRERPFCLEPDLELANLPSRPRMTLKLLHMTNAAAFHSFLGALIKSRGLVLSRDLVGILIVTMHQLVTSLLSIKHWVEPANKSLRQSEDVPIPLLDQVAERITSARFKEAVFALCDAFLINILPWEFEAMKVDNGDLILNLCTNAYTFPPLAGGL